MGTVVGCAYVNQILRSFVGENTLLMRMEILDKVELEYSLGSIMLRFLVIYQ